MEGEGYTSKAEFFRFLLKYYKYQKITEWQALTNETKELGDLLLRLNKAGKLKDNLEEII